MMTDLHFLQPLLSELQVAKEKALTCDEGQYKLAGSHFGGAKCNNTYYVYCISDYEPANCNKKIKLPGWENIRPAKEISIMEQMEISLQPPKGEQHGDKNAHISDQLSRDGTT